MQDIQVIQVRLDELEPDLTEAIRVIAGYLALLWCKPCLHNTRHFARWMIDFSCIFKVLSCDDLVVYNAHLGETFAKLAVSRMWTVASRLVNEAVELQQLPSSHIKCIHGFKTCNDESLHRPLKIEVTRALLEFIDDGMTQGKRDQALFILLLRTDIRYSEVDVLTHGNMTIDQGYHLTVIQHGKGNKRDFARLSHEVKQVSDIYLEAVGLNEACPEASCIGDPLAEINRRGLWPVS